MRRAGRFTDALNLSVRVGAGLTRVFNDRHPYALFAQINHASDLYAMGDAPQARELDEHSYRLLAEVLGEDHPDTLAAGCNLSISRSADGDTGTGDSLRLNVLRQMIAKLGERHPNCRAIREGTRLNLDIEQPLI
jgi:hypothetical protein